MFEDPAVLERLRFVLPIIAGDLTINEASEQTGRSRTAIKQFVNRYKEFGVEGLRNKPRGNSKPVSPEDEEKILKLKRERRSRSCRKIRDLLREQGIHHHRQTIWRILCKHGEHRREPKPLKPDKDFEYPEPNDCWQTDIMDGIMVKGVGLVYLHSFLDDHSRYTTGSGWFTNRSAQNMLSVLKDAIEVNGLPKRIIADRGTQFKNNLGPGLTQFEKILARLGIQAIFASKGHPKTKGKKERYYRFVQEDFLSEYEFTSLEDLNDKWKIWLKWYHEKHEHSSLNGATPGERYARVRKRFSPFPLEDVFATVVERKVRTNASVSFRRNVYLVDDTLIGQTVELRAFNNQV